MIGFRAPSAPYSIVESRDLFKRFNVFFVEEKAWFARELKRRRHGIGFAELNAIRAATFDLWDAASTKKGKGRPGGTDGTDEFKNNPVVQNVGQAAWDALNAAFDDGEETEEE